MDIKHIKLQGSIEALSRNIQSRIWDARKSLDEAPHENWRTFRENINAASVAISEMEELFTEMMRLKNA